jgi:hypothetical protein
MIKKAITGLGLFLLYSASVYSQYKMDCNTIFACIDTNSYAALFQNSFVKDSLFVCRENTTKTDSDVYTGKYFIGEFGTLEFFQPSEKNKFGDHLGDFGIEFKTRNQKELTEILRNNKGKSVAIEKTYEIIDNEKFLWYQSIKDTSATTNLQLSALEYSSDYLQQLGFSKDEIEGEISPEKFNTIAYQNKAYPRKFKSLKSITIEVSSQGERELKQFSRQFQFDFHRKYVNCNGFIIQYTVNRAAKVTKLKNIQFNLRSSVPKKTIAIAENISLSIADTTANLIFK